ncbi:putative DMBT1-like protein [Pomacea canaliculata]|uniref:putative DMBT1-like protein n=1 Tax=Pomacea canaliculata TaxID=400727 RepID=UPI000D731832|nr:putative DMBT1-like protein [Pomacea canaliculata]
MEGTNVTLKCVSSQRGLSHLNFSWPETAGGRPSGEYLIFDNLTRSHNGGRVRCMASHGQPPRKEIITSDTLAMNVYYRPVVRIKWEGNTCEPLESSPSRCVVSQYQQVILYCEADSNPPPASARWSGPVNSATGQLQISSANKTFHNGRYICIVSSKPLSSDGRLTLNSTYSFEVIVKYSSQVLNFQVNEEMQWVVTVPEHSRVYMRCEAEGRPSPHMTIVRDTGDKREVASRPRGALQLTDQRVVLTYNLTAAPYEASGNYRCEVDNGVGKDIQSIRIYVVSSQLTARLANGTWWAGRLEVLYDGRWSTVCDDDFDKNDARVACRMLGFDSPEALFVGSKMYGAGSGNILLGDLACTGTETSLAKCTHKGYNNHNCNHGKDVGVFCTIREDCFNFIHNMPRRMYSYLSSITAFT